MSVGERIHEQSFISKKSMSCNLNQLLIYVMHSLQGHLDGRQLFIFMRYCSIQSAESAFSKINFMAYDTSHPSISAYFTVVAGVVVMRCTCILRFNPPCATGGGGGAHRIQCDIVTFLRYTLY